MRHYKKVQVFFREIALLLRLYCNASFLFQFHSSTLYGEYFHCFFRTTWVLKSRRFFRFPNDPCLANFDISLSEGICYTSEQCLERGGSNGGICANGFGVCCICNVAEKKNLEILTFFIFTVRVSCQSSSSENCTVFTSNAFEVEQSLGNIFLNSIPKHVIFIFKVFE